MLKCRQSARRDIADICVDCRRTRILPYRMGLGQAMVRPHHRLEDLHPISCKRIRNTFPIHRPREYPEEVWRRTRLRVDLHAQHRACDRCSDGVEEPRHTKRQEDVPHRTDKVGRGTQWRDASMGRRQRERRATAKTGLHHPQARRLEDRPIPKHSCVRERRPPHNRRLRNTSPRYWR
jgi:hypothetical protein